MTKSCGKGLTETVKIPVEQEGIDINTKDEIYFKKLTYKKYVYPKWNKERE